MTHRTVKLRAGVLCLLALAAAPQRTSAAAPTAQAGPALRSEWLREPAKALAFLRGNADLWAKSYDPVGGGFFSLVRRDGTPVARAGLEIPDQDLKTVLSQSRIAYAFARAYMVSGDQKYLEQARRAIAFIRAHGWDQEHGGFRTALDGKGECIDLTSRNQRNQNSFAGEKWSFMQHYALLGIAAVADATRAPEDMELLLRGRKVIDEKLWDGRPGLEGYHETANYDWGRPRGKGFTPTVDGITTHGLSLYLLTRDDAHRKRLLALADAVVARLLPTARTRKLGFAESFDSDWRDRNEGFFFVGHVLKAGWCLGRAYMVEPKPEYLAGARELFTRVHDQAWDAVHGGPFYTGDSLTGKVTSREKSYWTVEQAITGGLVVYHLTGDPRFLEMADESMDFFTRHLVDREHGEVFDSVDETGDRPITTLKGSYWKSGYHAAETGYLVYLYGNLFLKREPVTLHYAIDPAGAPRTIPLDPIAIEQGALAIRKVRLDGRPYTAFDAAQRTLTVPAGTGGHFEVTFALAGGR